MPQDSRIINTDLPIGPIKTSGEVTGHKQRVPLQRVRIGKAGYVGDVDVYDPRFPNVNLVQEVNEPPPTPIEEEPEEDEEDEEDELPKKLPKKLVKKPSADKRLKAKAEDKAR